MIQVLYSPLTAYVYFNLRMLIFIEKAIILFTEFLHCISFFFQQKIFFQRAVFYSPYIYINNF